MPHTYHCQHQAESFANAIIPVPLDYPLKPGLPTDFRENFTALCRLAKEIYMDMAGQPEAYGIMLLDINETDHNRARDSCRTIHRFADVLLILFSSGKVSNHCLLVDSETFKKAIKKVPKHTLILSRLCDFGFAISQLEDNHFTVEYPDNPNIIDVIKIYCDEWFVYHQNRKTAEQGVKLRKNPDNPIKLAPEEFHHHFYRFDYKITADLAKIPMLTWVNDNADYQGFGAQLKQFNEAFYLESLKYDGVRFDGDYHYKSKRIARITHINYPALEKPDFRLSLKLPKPDKCMNIISEMPDSIKAMFAHDKCHHCAYQKTEDYCKLRLHWTYDGSAREGCSCLCFDFDDFNLALIQDYWRLLEAQYGIKKIK